MIVFFSETVNMAKGSFIRFARLRSRNR